MSEHFFAPCPRGLEALLAGELSTLGAAGARSVPGGVAFEGGWPVCYAANLHSRLASRVLWRVAEFRYANEDDIYRAAFAVDWRTHFVAGRTLRVNVTAQASPLRSIEFITLRIKDAICDRWRADTGIM